MSAEAYLCDWGGVAFPSIALLIQPARPSLCHAGQAGGGSVIGPLPVNSHLTGALTPFGPKSSATNCDQAFAFALSQAR
jgi:hypothetical protein